MSTSSIQYHSQDPWPSPYDMRASYYVRYTLVLNRSSVSLDHPSSPRMGPEPQKLLSRALLETDSSGLFPRGSASSFTRGLSLQLNFLSAAILEEEKKKKNLLGEWSPLPQSQRNTSSWSMLSLRAGRVLLPSWWCFLTWHLGGWGFMQILIRVFSQSPKTCLFLLPSRPRLFLLQCSRFQSLNLRVIPLGTGQTKGEGLSPFELLGNGTRGLFHRFVRSRVTLSRDMTPTWNLSSTCTTVCYWGQHGVSGHFLWTQLWTGSPVLL